MTGEPDRSARLDVLLVEDEEDIRDGLAAVLRRGGHRVTAVGDGKSAFDRIEDELYDLVICDVRLPQIDGMELLHHIRRQAPQSQVIMMSAYGDVAEAVAAMKAEAMHYLAKPFEVQALTDLVAHIAHLRALRTGPSTESTLVGETRQMVRLREMIDSIAQSEASVLVTGESGTGKELVARAIHAKSARKDGPFVAVNCAAFPETLLEAELFGHERGAFTGASQERKGRVAAADSGTLFLDEVAEMAYVAQAKLLRFLEDRSFQRLGSNESRRSDVRIISATNADVRRAVEEGAFREDIYHRLKVFHLQLPPLRERKQDLPLLLNSLHRTLRGEDATLPDFTPAAWAAIDAYHFPGNVRELRHILEHAVVLSSGKTIGLEHLPEELRGRPLHQSDREPFLELPEAVARFERDYLLRALRRCEWQKAKTSDLLGISRKTLWQKLKAHGIEEG